MKETQRSRKNPQTVKTLPGLLMALAMLASQIVVIPMAFSSFRLAKSVVVLALLACAAVVWFFLRAAEGRIQLVGFPVIGVLAAYPVFLGMSALWAPSPARALMAAGVAAIWILGLLVLTGLGEGELRRASWWAVAGGVVSAAVALAQTGGVSPFQLGGVKGRLKIVGLAGNPSDLAAACVMLLPLLFVGVDHSRRTWLRMVAGGVLAAGVLVSQSRAGLAAFFLEALVLLGWLVSRHTSKRVLLSGAVILVILLGIGIWTVIPRVQWTIKETRSHGLLSAINRDGGWTAAAVMIREHPWLGIGGGSFSCRFAQARLEYLQAHDRVGYKRIGFASHFPNVHDDPLQVAAELGAVGTLWMIALGIVLAWIRPWRSLPLAMAMAGLAPFLFFHYPCHITVALAPMMLLIAIAVRRSDPARSPLVFRRSGWLLFLAVLAIAAVVVWVGIRTLRLDIWRKNANMTLELVQIRTRQGRLPAKARKMLLSGLDTEGTARLGKAPGADAWLWRIIGLSRLGRGDAVDAEAAFRKSLSVCPHEEAYLGLGIALVDQGRINEAFPWLADACRVDPNLAKVIPDSALRQTVMGSIGAVN